MAVSRQQKTAWIIALSYVVFIYATLGVVRIPVNFLRDLGLLRLTLAGFYFLGAGVLLYLLAKSDKKSWMKLAGIIAVFFLYALSTRWVQTPEEQIHFFQYGLVGVLFACALEIPKGFGMAVFLKALIIGGFTGWMDELIQGWLPSRHYDVRDIFLNIVSVLLGLIILTIFRLGKATPRPPLHFPRNSK